MERLKIQIVKPDRIVAGNQIFSLDTKGLNKGDTIIAEVGEKNIIKNWTLEKDLIPEKDIKLRIVKIDKEIVHVIRDNTGFNVKLLKGIPVPILGEIIGDLQVIGNEYFLSSWHTEQKEIDHIDKVESKSMIQERYDLIENQALVILKDILGRNPNSVGEFNAWKTLFIAIDNKQKLHKDNIEDIASICSDLYNECYDHAKDLFGEIKDEHYTFINNRFIELKKYK